MDTLKSARLPLSAVTLCVAIFGGACGVAAQPAVGESNPASTARVVERLGYRVELDTGPPKGSRSIYMNWHSSRPGAAAIAERLVVTRQVLGDDPLPRQRSGEIGEGQLLLLVLDKGGTVRYTRVIGDPRLIIAEFPDSTGKLQRHDFVRNDVAIELIVPGSIDVGEVRIMKPSWSPSGVLQLAPMSAATVANTE